MHFGAHHSTIDDWTFDHHRPNNQCQDWTFGSVQNCLIKALSMVYHCIYDLSSQDIMK